MSSAAFRRDREHILLESGNIWEGLRNARVFVTGGTGFVGTWMIEAFAAANKRYRLNANAVLLTRGAAKFRTRSPHLADDSAISFVVGDASSFEFPEGEFSYVIHAATERAAPADPKRPVGTLSADIASTHRVLDFASSHGVRRFLFTSSGAVYGQTSGATGIPESHMGAPNVLSPSAEYGEGKRVSEFACASYGRTFKFDVMVARLFAFVGPHLPLGEGYAIGNFIADALAGRPIAVGGDGTARRSYLYAADLAIWLWTILIRGNAGHAYNVGSSAELSIRELADLVVTSLVPSSYVTVANKPIRGAAPSRYVPDVSRAQKELGLKVWVDLPDALRRTYEFYRESREAKGRE